MRKVFAIGLVFLFLTSSAFAGVGFKGRPITNNLWMPSGYSLNQGEFTVGIGSIGFGITDKIQVGTNILPFLFQYYNANVKVSLIKSPSMAFATGIDLGHFNLDVLDAEPSFTSLSPYLALTPKIGEKINLHLAGQYSYFSSEADIEEAEVKWTSKGTSVSAGMEYIMSHKTRFLAEASYDTTFKGFRLGGGVLFGWEKFRLKLGVGYYNPEGANGGFTLPLIGLWWRFKG